MSVSCVSYLNALDRASAACVNKSSRAYLHENGESAQDLIVRINEHFQHFLGVHASLSEDCKFADLEFLENLGLFNQICLSIRNQGGIPKHSALKCRTFLKDPSQVFTQATTLQEVFTTAIYLQNINMLRWLFSTTITLKINPNTPLGVFDGVAVYPLTQVVHKENYEITKFLLEMRADPNIDRTGCPPLLELADRGHSNTSIVDLLIDFKADINIKVPLPPHPDLPVGEFDTPLHDAVVRNNPIMLEYFLKKGADHTIANKGHQTPFLLAIEEGRTQSVQILKKYVNLEQELITLIEKDQIEKACNLVWVYPKLLQSSDARVQKIAARNDVKNMELRGKVVELPNTNEELIKLIIKNYKTKFDLTDPIASLAISTLLMHFDCTHSLMKAVAIPKLLNTTIQESRKHPGAEHWHLETVYSGSLIYGLKIKILGLDPDDFKRIKNAKFVLEEDSFHLEPESPLKSKEAQEAWKELHKLAGAFIKHKSFVDTLANVYRQGNKEASSLSK